MELAKMLTGLAGTLATTAKELLFKGIDEAIEKLQEYKEEILSDDNEYNDLAVPFIDALIDILDNADGTDDV